ncbi:MAG: response regulator [Spirochaetes bacterium]|nr:response regulator [Spirochaetota bacterium]
MKKSVLELMIAELSILHELASLAFKGSLEDFHRDCIDLATRLFGARRIAIAWEDGGSPRIAASLGLPPGAPLPADSQGGFSHRFADRGERGVLFMELGHPVEKREERLYAFFARKVEDGLKAARGAEHRARMEREKADLERQVLHVQKLESLGILAGGIAHDFNNLLTAVEGNLDLALLSLGAPGASPAAGAADFIRQAMAAARRAEDLTRQMLAYSGKGRFIKQWVDLSALVEENAHLLHASLSKRVGLTLELSTGLPGILIDPGQVQQVVMNLITNASEAIGDRDGRVTLATRLVHCDSDELQGSRLEEKPDPGDFIALEVRDTGVGMDDETVRRVFDPFFSTKFTGRGLGMSAVLGILRGHQGAIFIESGLDRGTTVRVLFPVLAASGSPAEPPSAEPERAPGRPGATILVIDDEEPVRLLCRSMLEHSGYRVLTAADGREGVDLLRAGSSRVDGVLLDLTMPQMDGVRAFAELRRIRPEVKILVTSGYSEQEVVRQFQGRGHEAFLQKPFGLAALQAALAKLLSA